MHRFIGTAVLTTCRNQKRSLLQKRLFFHSNRDFILFFRPRRNQPRKRISRQVMLSFQEKLFSKCFRANSMNHNDKQVSPCSLECPFSCNHTPRQTGIEISSIPSNLIIVIFYYQIPLKPLKTLSLSPVSFSLLFPLCYIVPSVFTNSHTGKYKGKKNL